MFRSHSVISSEREARGPLQEPRSHGAREAVMTDPWNQGPGDAGDAAKGMAVIS